MDYSFGEKRKSKNDKRAKARFNRYRKGGGKTSRTKEQDKFRRD